MDILFLTNIPSPYRVNFFNELGKHCNLTVIFERSNSAERDNSWCNYKFDNFQGIVLSGKSVGADKSISFSVKKYLNKDIYDAIVVGNAMTPTGMIAIQYMKNHRIPYWIEGDGAFPKEDNGLKKHIKSHFIKGADGYFSTSDMLDKYYIEYGADKNKIYRYPFTSLYEKDILTEILKHEDKVNLKNKLGIKEEKIIISVGQFIYRKGFDVLLKATKELQDNNIGIYIIGGTPTEEYKNLIRDLTIEKQVHFHKFMDKNTLNQWYRASDLFVLPTREDIWGLVINEAMSNGLPVVTTNRCISGLELIKNGENGYIVPPDDSNKLSEAIKNVFEGNRNKMGMNSLKQIKNYTIEKMSKRHMEVFGAQAKG